MADLINLKRFKKRADRAEASEKAEINRVLFGRSKSEKLRDEKQARHSKKLLDGHRIGENAK